MKYRIFSLLFALMAVTGCSTIKKIEKESYLIMESNENSPEVVENILYFYRYAGAVNKQKFKVNNLEYNIIRMYLTKDGFRIMPCCEFGLVQNLSKDTEKLMKIFSEKEFDSISVKYSNVFDELTNEVYTIKSEKKFIYKKGDKLFRIFSANDLKYCECVNEKYKNDDPKKLKRIDEGFIQSIGKVKSLSDEQINEIIIHVIKINAYYNL